MNAATPESEFHVPIVLCAHAPSSTGPVLLLPGQPCPFCGEPIADHDTIDDHADSAL